MGQKTKAGIFKKVGTAILVLDVATQDYRPATGETAEEVKAILKSKNPVAATL